MTSSDQAQLETLLWVVLLSLLAVVVALVVLARKRPPPPSGGEWAGGLALPAALTAALTGRARGDGARVAFESRRALHSRGSHFA